LLGRCSTISATLPALFAFSYISIMSCVYAQASLDHPPPIYTYFVAGMTGVHHDTQIFF
jgi:hypothetical protein